MTYKVAWSIGHPGAVADILDVVQTGGKLSGCISISSNMWIFIFFIFLFRKHDGKLLDLKTFLKIFPFEEFFHAVTQTARWTRGLSICEGPIVEVHQLDMMKTII